MPTINQPRPKQIPQAQKSSGSNNNTFGILIVVAVLALVAVGYFVGYPFLQKFMKPRPAMITVIPPVDTTTVVIPDVEEIVVQQELPSIPKGYYIIVGSFRHQNNAGNMAQNMRKDFELNVLYFEELELYRVSAGFYENIHKAYNDLYSIKDLDGCADAWVLENM